MQSLERQALGQQTLQRRAPLLLCLQQQLQRRRQLVLAARLLPMALGSQEQQQEAVLGERGRLAAHLLGWRQHC